jgi:pyridinium-3,5-biscarboxylic acid mononucleotide synthase
MTDTELSELLDQVRDQKLSTEQALSRLQNGPFQRTQLPYAELDHHRSVRHGIGEVVYGESKSSEQIISIVEHLASQGRSVLITRLDKNKLEVLKDRFPDGRENSLGRTFIANAPAQKDSTAGEPFVAVIAAGTSDAYVAEEAFETCIAMNTSVEKHYDVGVAGLHRILDRRSALENASALIVVAGMEGALPSVVGGLFGKPLFAVPTSVGYGASFGGIAALLGMLNSCAAGVAVMNIDNGFSAGFAAAQVIREIKRAAK